MKEWFNRMFCSQEQLGDKILSVVIGLFTIGLVLYIFSALLFLLVNILLYILEFIERKYRFSFHTLEHILSLFAEWLIQVVRKPYKLIPGRNILYVFISKSRLESLWDIFIGISIPLVVALIWLFSKSGPVNDYLLITKSTSTNGQITKVELDFEEVETNDGRSVDVAYFYGYEYNFKLPSGKVIKGFGNESRDLANDILDQEVPFDVKIEYLAGDPQVSRVKGMASNDTTVLQWIRHRMIFQSFIFLFVCYLGYTSIRSGFKAYSDRKNNDTGSAINIFFFITIFVF
jgi:hypothetical protein